MERRAFLRGATLGAAALASSCSGPSSRSATPIDLEEATLGDLQDSMRAGRETARSLVERYLRRIAEIDRSGPALNSVIELNPDATDIALELDDERRTQGPRGPLHGIPVLIKDNIGTHDRMTTTAGSLALEGSIPAQDSAVARRLRRAGAVILGKTNLSEWANFRSSPSTSGWSGRGGLTRNPYALDRNPSGSSSGSAVAVSASLCGVAVGTETDGSIVSPSSICGIVGIKPTVGLVSRSGIIPIAHTQDTAGPMARTVTDAAILLGALAGEDPSDPATAPGMGSAHADYTRFLDPEGLRGARLGVARRFFRAGSIADRVLDAAVEEMRRRGAIVVDPAEIPTHGRLGESEFDLLLYEFKAGLNAYLSDLGPKAPVHSLAEVIEFNLRNQERELRFAGQETLIKAQSKGPLTEKAYLDAVAKGHRLSRDEGIDAVMSEFRLDALVAPTAGPAAKTDLVHGDRGVGGSSSPAAIAGYPSVTVPAGEAFGLPVGISFFGRAWTEAVLVKIAFGFEQATRARRVPRFPPTVG
jgi:amidase